MVTQYRTLSLQGHQLSRQLFNIENFIFCNLTRENRTISILNMLSRREYMISKFYII